MSNLQANAPYPFYEVDPAEDLRQLVRLWSEKYSERCAFRYSTDGVISDVSYRGFADDVAALGTAFLDLDLQGAKIALIGDNSYEWLLVYFAAVNSGNIIVPLDRDLGKDEVHYILNNCEAEILFFAPRFQAVVEALTGKIPAMRRCIVLDTVEPDFVHLLEHGRELLARGDVRFNAVQVDANACTAILYTSGTTGLSKGVMLSHRNLACDAASSIRNIRLTERTLCVLPLHHSFSFTANILCSLHSGVTICINKSLKDLAGDLILFKPKYLFLVPMIVESLYKKVWIAMRKAGREEWLKQVIAHTDALYALGVDLRRVIFQSVLAGFGGELDLIISGGAALDAAYVDRYRSFGIDLLEGYGITECSPVVAVNRNAYNRAGTVGLPVQGGCEVEIYKPDENGEGEVLVKGDIVMLGYYNNPEAMQDAFVDGWFRTGDIGTLRDGFLAITGRKKNLIILANGKNIYPEELELKIMALPEVQEVLVYAREGTIVADVFPNAEYVLDRGITNVEAVLQQGIDVINDSLPRHKRIADLRLRDVEFEKTGSRKIKRQQSSLR